MPKIGVTRVAEVTRLDRVGIANFISVRPRERGGGISYFNGKGSTKQAARAGAMMEALEHFSGETCDLPVLYRSHAEIQREGRAVNPEELITPRYGDYNPRARLEWVRGFDLISRRPTYVPLNAVVCPYQPARGRALFYASTNGLASGNTIEEALCHALCEVIERDAISISTTLLELAPAVSDVLGGMGLGRGAKQSSRRTSRYDLFPLIDLDTLPRPSRGMARKLRAAGLHVYLRDITCTAGVPTLDCTVIEEQFDGRHLTHGGTGTHPDARVAASRAVSEAAQSRLACIQGGREDLPEVMRQRDPFDHEELFGRGPVVPFDSIRAYEHERVDEDVRFLLRQLKRDGFAQCVAFDMTRPQLGVPVVRVVLPKAETWPVFHLHTERGAFGPRVAEVIKDGRSCASLFKSLSMSKRSGSSSLASAARGSKGSN
jgi:ribosomal protein S12 methylthiotransferase accessory factor